jgi:hypothetical protein
MTSKQNAVELLKADHRKVEDLFSKFEAARSDDAKQDIVGQICTELIVHSSIEEEIFYPACQGEIDDDTLDEAYVEHDSAKVLIADLLESKPDDDFYDAKVTVLSEQIKHHVKEEEAALDGMFAQAKKADLDLDALGERLAQRKQELLAEIKSSGLPQLETRTFVGHDLALGVPLD